MKVVVIVIFIILYILLGIFLNKFNELLGNKKTIIAYVPIMNIYLLGKIAVDDFFGIAMSLYFIVAHGNYSIKIGDTSISGNFLSGNFGLVMRIVYDILLLTVLIYLVYKYFYMERKFENPLILKKQEHKQVIKHEKINTDKQQVVDNKINKETNNSSLEDLFKSPFE